MSEESKGKKVVSPGIQALRISGAKPHSVQIGAETFHFKKDTYEITRALSEEIKALRDALGVAPDIPTDDADKVAWVQYHDANDEYQLRSNETMVKIAAIIMQRKQTDSKGNLLFDGVSAEEIESTLTVTDAQKFMQAHGAFQVGLNKVPDAVARFQNG